MIKKILGKVKVFSFLINKSKEKINCLTREQNTQYKQTSYSQCGEDLIVKFIFDCLKIKNPTYLDIGAHHPYYISNTALFYENGSTGINIEPDPLLFKEFLKERPRDVNLNIGVNDQNSELDFYIISSPTLNTFSKHEAENYSKEGDYHIVDTKKVLVKTLDAILKEVGDDRLPQFLTIDAEGVDDIIIRSIDFQTNYPIVICIETISFSTSGNGFKNDALIEFIKSKGYFMYADTYINTIFVRESIWKKQNR